MGRFFFFIHQRSNAQILDKHHDGKEPSQNTGGGEVPGDLGAKGTGGQGSKAFGGKGIMRARKSAPCFREQLALRASSVQMPIPNALALSQPVEPALRVSAFERWKQSMELEPRRSGSGTHTCFPFTPDLGWFVLGISSFSTEGSWHEPESFTSP